MVSVKQENKYMNFWLSDPTTSSRPWFPCKTHTGIPFPCFKLVNSIARCLVNAPVCLPPRLADQNWALEIDRQIFWKTIPPSYVDMQDKYILHNMKVNYQDKIIEVQDNTHHFVDVFITLVLSNIMWKHNSHVNTRSLKSCDRGKTMTQCSNAKECGSPILKPLLHFITFFHHVYFSYGHGHCACQSDQRVLINTGKTKS